MIQNTKGVSLSSPRREVSQKFLTVGYLNLWKTHPGRNMLRPSPRLGFYSYAIGVINVMEGWGLLCEKSHELTIMGLFSQ